MKTIISIGIVLTIAGILGCCVGAETYTAKVSSPFGGSVMTTFTNCVSVGRCPKGNGACQLVRYVQDGQTNDFHAWLVNVSVTTNSTKGVK